LQTHRNQRQADREAADKAAADAAKTGGSDELDEAARAEKDARDERIFKHDSLQRIVPFGKLAATGVFELRIMDRDRAKGGDRINQLEGKLSLDVLPVTEGPNVAGLAGEYKVFDYVETTRVKTPEEIKVALDEYKEPDAYVSKFSCPFDCVSEYVHISS
jgi:hypothetical protein